MPAFISAALAGRRRSRASRCKTTWCSCAAARRSPSSTPRRNPPGLDEAPGSPSASRRPRIIFLLISQEYIASDAYYEDQLLRAVERHSRGEVTIVPDPLLSPYRFSDEPFAGLVFLPRRPVYGSRKFADEPVVANKACPVDQYPGGRDKAFEGIAQEVRQTVERILAGGGEIRLK